MLQYGVLLCPKPCLLLDTMLENKQLEQVKLNNGSTDQAGKAITEYGRHNVD